MTYLVLILVSLALLTGFLALTAFEARRGTRVLASSRADLDREVERLSFIASHVDFGAFLREGFMHVVRRFGHDVAHLSLQMTRSVERLLTRLVKHLRARSVAPAPSAPREASREFVKTLSDFKGQLEATRPEMPQVR